MEHWRGAGYDTSLLEDSLTLESLVTESLAAEFLAEEWREKGSSSSDLTLTDLRLDLFAFHEKAVEV